MRARENAAPAVDEEDVSGRTHFVIYTPAYKVKFTEKEKSLQEMDFVIFVSSHFFCAWFLSLDVFRNSRFLYFLLRDIETYS